MALGLISCIGGVSTEANDLLYKLGTGIFHAAVEVGSRGWRDPSPPKKMSVSWICETCCCIEFGGVRRTSAFSLVFFVGGGFE